MATGDTERNGPVQLQLGEKPPLAAHDSSVLDLAFAIDVTGSMGAYIAAAQQSIRHIVEEIVAAEKSDVRLALVEYRDHPPQEHTFVTRTHDFIDSVKTMKSWLDESSASGGGDLPEAVADALHDVLKLSWREEATKICVLISDAPPHGLIRHASGGGLFGQGSDVFPNGCPDGLDPVVIINKIAMKNITLYSVGCEPALVPYKDFFMALAHITGGQYVPLRNAKLLAKVIIGGAQEEITLQRLMGEVHEEVVQQIGLFGGTANLNEDEIAERVHMKLTSQGAQTKALFGSGAALAAASGFAQNMATKGSSMAEWREEWATKKPSEPAHVGFGGGSFGSSSDAGFSFGGGSAAPSTGVMFGSSSGLFGSSYTTGGSSGGLFGSSAAPTTAPSSFSFGSTAATTATSGSGFGGTATPTALPGVGFGSTATTTASSGLSFGSTAATTAPSSFSFGSNAAKTATSGFGFGGTATPTALPGCFGSTATTTANSGFGFGSTVTATAPSGGDLLFGTCGTSAAPIASPFGVSSTGNSFGTTYFARPSTTISTDTNEKLPPGALFGNSTATTTESPGGFSLSSAVPSGGLFGATSTVPSGGLFGATSAVPFGGSFGQTSTAPSGGLFGATSAVPFGGSFGQTSTAPSGGLFGATSTVPAGGLFGGTYGSAAPPQLPQSQSTENENEQSFSVVDTALTLEQAKRMVKKSIAMNKDV